jgi:hypothetical protein
MNKSRIKLYFKKRKQRLSVFGVSPVFDWRFILGSGALIVLCGIVYAVYLYTNINNDTFFETTQDQSSQVELDKKKVQIQKTVELLEKRNFDETVLN